MLIFKIENNDFHNFKDRQNVLDLLDQIQDSNKLVAELKDWEINCWYILAYIFCKFIFLFETSICSFFLSVSQIAAKILPQFILWRFYFLLWN